MGVARKYHNVQILPVLNGFIVNVGCQTAVFDNVDKMAMELGMYYKDPEGTEKRYRENSLAFGSMPIAPPQNCAVDPVEPSITVGSATLNRNY